MMKQFTVNVHYDYVAVIGVEAENEEQAFEIAKRAADNVPQDELEYVGFTGVCLGEQ